MLFAWVFADQAGIPIPVVPLLLGAGALAGGQRLSLSLAIALAVAASLVADLAWYAVGRRRLGGDLDRPRIRYERRHRGSGGGGITAWPRRPCPSGHRSGCVPCDQVRAAPPLPATAPRRPHQSRRASATGRRRGATDDRGSAYRLGRERRPLYDSRCPPGSRRGSGAAPLGDSARRRNRSLLFLTQRSDQRPGGARPAAKGNHAGSPSRGRPVGLARQGFPGAAAGGLSPSSRLRN